MRFRVVWYVLSKLMVAEAVIFLVPLAAAIWYGETALWTFFLAAALTAALAIEMRRRGKAVDENLTMREGIAITGLGWVFATCMGMLPYLLSGVLMPLDALFESLSGFTGTGCTVITDLAALPNSMHVWRMMTHWFGGLGIIVIFIALLPQTGQSTVYMYNAETSGPSKERVLPRLRDMTRILFRIYLLFTALAFLVYLVCGMTPLTAFLHAMSTLSTGGFSTFDDNAIHFGSWPLEACMTFFMILAGGNFGLYYRVWKKGPGVLRRNTEFKAYLAVELCAMLLITLNLIDRMDMHPAEAFRYASFQVGSLSTTGFVSADFDQWPGFSKGILLLLMIGGGCAGSTAGGIKISRVVLLFKEAWRVVHQKVSPHRVLGVYMNGQHIPDETVLRVGEFFFLYIFCIGFFALLFTLDGIRAFDALGMSVSTIGNVGPAFGIAGATQNFAGLPVFTKVALCFEMLLGRLEIFTFLAMLRPSFWLRRNQW